MAIKLGDLDFSTPLPTLPPSIPVYAVTAPSLQERRPAIGRLAEHLGLRDLREVSLDHALVMASKQGDITVFHASGAVWARDATAAAGAKNELRTWDGQTDSGTGGERLTLRPEAAKRLSTRTKDLLSSFGLLGKEVASEAVQLDQVAHLDASGKEMEHGAGQASVKFSYAVGGVPVRGGGGKTVAFFEPGDGQPRLAGVFHGWRTVDGATAVGLQPLEEALGAGVLTDPELVRYQAAGHRIQITRLELVYLALPAFMRQSHLIPAFQVEGTVSQGKLGISFHFGRFHHAVPPKAYAAADLHGSWLTINPDGITPTPTANQFR